MIADFNDEEPEIIDIGAGLCSLSMPFIKFGFPTLLIEYNEDIYDSIKCLEEMPNVEVVNKNYFDTDMKIEKNESIVILCNPPFRAHILGNNEKKAYLFFMVDVIEKLENFVLQHAYFIVPNSEHFTINGDKINMEKDVGKQVNLNIKGALWKRMNKNLKLDYDDDEYDFDYITYLMPVTDFKGISKTGAPRKAPDAILLKVGM